MNNIRAAKHVRWADHYNQSLERIRIISDQKIQSVALPLLKKILLISAILTLTLPSIGLLPASSAFLSLPALGFYYLLD